MPGLIGKACSLGGDTGISISPDGRLFAADGSDGNIQIWNIQQWRLAKTTGLLTLGTILSFLPTVTYWQTAVGTV
jgi:WD40 repeat protein